MKKAKIFITAGIVVLIMNSCIGSFKLTNQLIDWNKDVGSKFANEVIFVAFHIIPIYEFCYLADWLVLNSVEFWKDDNSLALKSGDIKEFEHDGVFYTVTRKRNKLRIEQTDNKNVYAELSYDRIKKSWRVKNDSYNQEIMRFLDDSKIEVYFPNNKKQVFDISEKGAEELREIVSNDIPLK
ncbi:MAG: DUF3332 domain-containing protein [Prevotellaceae bacterium]|jgi:hypothetical protein|nr:DUF3332 domain-containing protein [Prevotellaceae bacterium]